MTHDIINILNQIPGFYNYAIAAILIFARMIAFFHICPVFRRKEVVFMAKLGLSMMFTFILLPTLDIGKVPQDIPFIFLIFINTLEGLFLGLICLMIFDAIQAAGDLANNQMSLSSASMFDQSTKSQTSIIGQVFSLLGTVIFINIGGVQWMIAAFTRSFEIFPIFNPIPNFPDNVPLDYWIYISGNVIFMGFQIVAPIVIVTLAIDIILGIISKTAPQINVFQLSFVFKPVVGCGVLLATLPLLLRILEDYFMQHARFF